MFKILIELCLIIAVVMAWRSGLGALTNWVAQKSELRRRRVFLGVATVSLLDLLLALAILIVASFIFWALDRGYLPQIPM